MSSGVLAILIKAVLYRICPVLTDNGIQLTDSIRHFRPARYLLH